MSEFELSMIAEEVSARRLFAVFDGDSLTVIAIEFRGVTNDTGEPVACRVSIHPNDIASVIDIVTAARDSGRTR